MGQSNYGAGSTYQDSLAHYRRARGLQAVSLDLGIIKDVGVLAETGMTDNLKDWAAFGIGEAEPHSLFRNVIQDQAAGTFSIPPQVPTGFASLRDAQVAGVDPPFYLNDPRFSILGQDGLVAGQQSKAAQTFKQRLESAKAATAVHEVESIILEMLVHKVAQCLKLAEAEVDESRSLPSYGINSLVAIEIRNWIFKEIAVDITMFNLISNVPLRKLAEKLVLSVMPAN